MKTLEVPTDLMQQQVEAASRALQSLAGSTGQISKKSAANVSDCYGGSYYMGALIGVVDKRMRNMTGAKGGRLKLTDFTPARLAKLKGSIARLSKGTSVSQATITASRSNTAKFSFWLAARERSSGEGFGIKPTLRGIAGRVISSAAWLVSSKKRDQMILDECVRYDLKHDEHGPFYKVSLGIVDAEGKERILFVDANTMQTFDPKADR